MDETLEAPQPGSNSEDQKREALEFLCPTAQGEEAEFEAKTLDLLEKLKIAEPAYTH